jgi:hypothetical protein
MSLPGHVETRMKRGRKSMTANAPKYRLCRKFEKGETFWYLNQDGALRQQATVTHVNGGGKPGHRIRLSHNFIRPIIEGKISAATQRIPSYEVLPSTTDFERMSSAKLAEDAPFQGDALEEALPEGLDLVTYLRQAGLHKLAAEARDLSERIRQLLLAREDEDGRRQGSRR